MHISRRGLLKRALAAGAATTLTRRAEARERRESSPEAVGMLYDSTRCIGCRACVTRCKQANGLPYDKTTTGGGVYDAPADLNGSTKNVIKVFSENGKSAFIKAQCMHCVDPSCTSACMLGALHKEGAGRRDMGDEKKGTGIVIYDKGLCVGCRYCQIACAFNVPRFEWFKALPLIVKCELCRHRRDPGCEGPLSVANPACCEVCPREAVVYGRRVDLLAEAKRRLVAEPQRYNGQVYGEKDGGGTQVLYLAGAGISFQQLGLPKLSEESNAHLSESISHAPYLHGLTPIALYTAAAFIISRNRKKEEGQHQQEGG